MQPVRVTNENTRHKIELGRAGRERQGSDDEEHPWAIARGQERACTAREVLRETGQGDGRQAMSEG